MLCDWLYGISCVSDYADKIEIAMTLVKGNSRQIWHFCRYPMERAAKSQRSANISIVSAHYLFCGIKSFKQEQVGSWRLEPVP